MCFQHETCMICCKYNSASDISAKLTRFGVSSCTDVPRPLTNDPCVFLFRTIDAECVEWASPTGTYMFIKAFIVNVNKRLKPFFLEQHINIVNRVKLQSFWFIFTCDIKLFHACLLYSPNYYPTVYIRSNCLLCAMSWVTKLFHWQ